MPLFEYTARNAANGQIQKGQVEVKSKEEVSAYLRKNRMILVSVREAPTKITLGSLRKGKVKTRDIVIFTRQFATMINAGLPLVQSLSILASQTENKTLQEVTKAVVHDVEAGNTLADAFSKHPKAFTDLYVNMVAAGEAGGILDTILIRLATFLEKSDALIRKVKGAMVYPAVRHHDHRRSAAGAVSEHSRIANREQDAPGGD
jgi:type IV pilus assembly protein PilC